VITIGRGIGSAVGSWAAGWIFDLLTVPQSVLPDEVIE
jgi:hypothetical protein